MPESTPGDTSPAAHERNAMSNGRSRLDKPVSEPVSARAAGHTARPAIGRVAPWLGEWQMVLWWLHSFWALGWGLLFMWLGSRQFVWLRWAFVYIAAIWASSLLLPVAVSSPRISARQAAALRLALNYLNKNFYQQLLFFVVPIYAASATWGSPNVLFVGLVFGSALLATFDVVYDRHVSASRGLTATFFGFNLFVCLNVMLPVLWSVSNLLAMRLSAALALLGFATLRYRLPQVRLAGTRWSLVATGALLVCLVEWGRPLIPPAPLGLMSAEFGRTFDRPHLAVGDRLTTLPPDFSGRVYVVSAVRAPLGLHDRVRHRWVRGGRVLQTSPYYALVGGRRDGFRLWTSVVLGATDVGPLELWVETDGGQIIGRARLDGPPTQSVVSPLRP